MLKMILSGCNGKMGQAVTRLCAERTDISIAAGFDMNAAKFSSFPVYADPMEYAGEADVLIDFSNALALGNLLNYCTARKLPCVLCTTGYENDQLVQISHASQKIPVFRSGNMSLGINLLIQLVKKASVVLGESFDVEIIEKHHRMKVDAPSGTALMLADAAAAALPHDSEYVYDRHNVRQKRRREEIGISSVRGGTIVGEHDVIFAGQDEVIELSHSATSRDVFANGALAAAVFLANIKEPGMYSMDNLLSQVTE